MGKNNEQLAMRKREKGTLRPLSLSKRPKGAGMRNYSPKLFPKDFTQRHDVF
jgi:hypothetical protein